MWCRHKSRGPRRFRSVANLVSFIIVVAVLLTAGQKASAQGEPPAVRVGGKVKPPRKVKDAKPVYPESAREAHIQGVVILEITVGTDGKVKKVKVVRSMRLLDNAAVAAAKKWVYKPTIVNGKPTPVIFTTAVNFKLD